MRFIKIGFGEAKKHSLGMTFYNEQYKKAEFEVFLRSFLYNKGKQSSTPITQ